MTTTAEAAKYTDAQAERYKLDSFYSWFDVRVNIAGDEADYVVGIDRSGVAFDVAWNGGDHLGLEGYDAARDAAVEAWKRGE